MEEIRVLLNEITFTNLVKSGFYKINNSSSTISFSSNDILAMCKRGEIVDKQINNKLYRFIVSDLGFDIYRDILKRSPIWSNLALEF
jgi:hypothetical protein